MERRMNGLKFVVLIYLFSQLVVSIESQRIHNQFYSQFEQKLLIRGDVIEMEYFNITFKNVNSIISERYITKHYFNLTIDDEISNSLIYYGLEVSIVKEFNVHIGDIIYFYRNPPFIKVRG